MRFEAAWTTHPLVPPNPRGEARIPQSTATLSSSSFPSMRSRSGLRAFSLKVTTAATTPLVGTVARAIRGWRTICRTGDKLAPPEPECSKRLG